LRKIGLLVSKPAFIEDIGEQRIEVTYNTDDYIFCSDYRVFGNTIIPVRARTGHAMALLFALVVGVNGTLLLNWLYKRMRKRTSAATVPVTG